LRINQDMNNEAMMQIFADAGAIITNDHFVFTAGAHSDTYINKDALYVHTKTISDLCKIMADHYDANEIDIVIGPVIGGVVLSQWVAHHLNCKRSSGESLSLYAEKEGEGKDKKFVIKRGYDSFIPGKTVLVVEDLLTTGDSARKVVECVKALGGKVVGLSVLCNRGGVTAEDVCNIPIKALTNVTLKMWDEDKCPLCKDKKPINIKLGKGKDFLEKRGLKV
jgi:orotate phosphoribosyltransferase